MTARALVAVAAAAFESLLCPGLAQADFKVWLPQVNFGEIALETVGDAGFDPNASKSGERSNTFEIEYGATPWWQTELELEFNRAPGRNQATYFNQITSENLFQFTERGEYVVDSGFFAEFGHALQRGNPDETTFGPIFRKDIWGTSNTINLFVQKELGQNAASGLFFVPAWETRIDAWTWRLGRRFIVAPGFQYYGQFGQFGRFPKWSEQDQRAGPQLFGKVFDIGPGTLEWNGGVLFGLTSAVPRTTLRWQAEYELHF